MSVNHAERIVLLVVQRRGFLKASIIYLMEGMDKHAVGRKKRCNIPQAKEV